MKGIMGKESSNVEQGVPSFSYCTADISMPFLFELGRPLDELEELIMTHYAGQTLTMKLVFERHHVGRRYIASNYKDALLSLERKGKIRVDPSVARRRRDTFGDAVVVTFPRVRGPK
jgi:hypothetical protein